MNYIKAYKISRILQIIWRLLLIIMLFNRLYNLTHEDLDISITLIVDALLFLFLTADVFIQHKYLRCPDCRASIKALRPKKDERVLCPKCYRELFNDHQ